MAKSEEKASALMLAPELAASVEPQTLAGLPGRWVPGQAYAPSALGLTLAEAKRRIADDNLPLQVVIVPVSEIASEFRRPSGSHASSAGAQTDRDMVEAPAAAETAEITSHAEADAQAAELGLDFPPKMRLPEKIEAIAAARAEADAVPLDAEVAETPSDAEIAAGAEAAEEDE